MVEVKTLFWSVISTGLKEEFYKTTIRPTMTYGVKCWLIVKQYMHKMSVDKNVEVNVWKN